MQNPLSIGLIVFGVILAGAFGGWAIKERLPKITSAMRQKAL
jgi:hypothetical protein